MVILGTGWVETRRPHPTSKQSYNLIASRYFLIIFPTIGFMNYQMPGH